MYKSSEWAARGITCRVMRRGMDWIGEDAAEATQQVKAATGNTLVRVQQ